MNADNEHPETSQQTQPQTPPLTKLTDPYDKEPFCNDQPAKVYIRLPLAEKRLIKVIHPEDNVYQYVISNLWYKLCRACEQRGITNFNDLEQFVDLVVNSELVLNERGDANKPSNSNERSLPGLPNRPSSGPASQGDARNDERGTGTVRNENSTTPKLNSNAEGGDRTTSGRSGPSGGTSQPAKDKPEVSKLTRPSRKSRS